MGMAASQARLLFLTSRLSDLELRSQVISNAKIRLADESSIASDEYTHALDKQKIQVATGANSSGTTYSPATAANLTTYDPNAGVSQSTQRFIKDNAGRVLVMQNVKDAYGKANDNVNLFLASVIGEKEMANYLVKSLSTAFKQIGVVVPTFDPTVATPDKAEVEYYTKVFNEIKTSGGCVAPGDDNMKSTDWLEAQVKEGNIRLFEPQKQANGTSPITEISWTSGDNNIQEVDDTTEVAKAEARYDATMAGIQSKDKRYDLQLKNIDTEHNATQTEVDSVKKVIEKNIERAFKMFQA